METHLSKTVQLAREAGWTSYDSQDERFKAFEALVRADERDVIISKLLEVGALEDGAFIEAIRARGNT
jgi:hypothetical protein